MRAEVERARPWRGWPALAWGIALFSLLLVLHASYPGYLNPDSFWLLEQIIAGHYTDWHGPFITWLWATLHAWWPGPAAFIAVDNLLIWAALALMAAAAAARVGGWSLLLLAVPWLPGAVNYLGHVHKDAMLVAWLLAAFACALCVQHSSGGVRRCWQLLANLLALAAFLTRSNVIFALLPLLLLANLPLGWRRSGGLALLLLVSMPAVQGLQNRLLDVEAMHPADSIKAYHLLAISYFENDNLFPGQGVAAEEVSVPSCYSPIQWDTMAHWGQCAALFDTLVREQIWGSDQLTAAWLKALVAHPLAAYSAMAVNFRRSMHEPNSRAMLYAQPHSAQIDYQFASPLRTSTTLMRGYIASDFNDRLSRPWIFALLLAGSGVLIFVLGLENSRDGLMALALIASASIYLLTYFPFNVSAEYRYFYWCGFAAYLSPMFVLYAWLGRRRGTAVPAAAVLPRVQRLALAAILGLMMALVFSAARLPQANRLVELRPAGNGRVELLEIRSESTPVWMHQAYQGESAAPGWTMGEQGQWVNEGSTAVLRVRLRTLHQHLRLSLRTGPEGGRVEVRADDVVYQVDTQAATDGQRVLRLPPQGRLEHERRHLPWQVPARVLLYAVLLTVLIFLLARRPAPAGAQR